MAGRLVSASLGLILAAVAGCNYQSKPIPNISVRECSVAVRGESYSVGAELFDTPKETEVSFNSKVNGKGFLPIYFMIENQGEGRAVFYGTGNVKFFDGRNVEWQEAGGALLASKTDRNPMLENMLAVNRVAGYWLSTSAKQYNSQMMEDFAKKVFPAQTVVNPHSTARGFVIFQKPKEVDGDEFKDRLKSSRAEIKVYVPQKGVDRHQLIFE